MKIAMKKVIITEKEIDKSKAVFTIQPYEKGYGTTVGNSLRRALLSSIAKFAPVAIHLVLKRKALSGKKKDKFDTIITVAKHQLDVLPGIYEDVFSIILNVKELVFSIDRKLFTNENEILSIEINDAIKEVYAKDLILPPGVKIINPELYLFTATPDEECISVSLKIYIRRGRGYWTAIQNKKSLQGNQSLEFGIISIDTNFSPIKKVAINVENLTGYSRPHEKLDITITTDGSLTPRHALERAAYILENQFSILAKKHDASLEIKEETDLPRVPKIQPVNLEELGLDKRTLNALRSAEIYDFATLAAKSTTELLKIPHLGEKSIAKLCEIIEAKKAK